MASLANAATQYNPGDVENALVSINSRWGRIAAPLRAEQRNYLAQLATALGCPYNAATLASDNDLVRLFEVALRDKGNAALIAARIALKYGASYNPFDQVDAKATPVATPPAPPVDTDAIVERVVKTVRPMLLKAQNSADELRGNVEHMMFEFIAALPFQVAQNVQEELAKLTPTRLVVETPSAAPVVLGLSHAKTAKIIMALSTGVNVYLHGPAGSGKTTVARQCAEAFNLAFYFNAKVESEYMLLGFKDARGETVRTQFREAYELGGVFLFDELDGSSPSAVVALNAALANGICPFPDGVIKRHPDFKCIAAGNTKLGGASREYVGRNQLDAASVDRFAFIEFGYDEALERALSADDIWCSYVQSARRAVATRALKHLVTPRATLDGCKLLASGFDWEEAEAMVLWKGLDADTVRQLKAAMDYKRPATPKVSIL